MDLLVSLGLVSLCANLMKLGIFGGTFDPIHQGHLLLARKALEQLGLDKVLFVPAFVPPHKKSRRDILPAPYRYEMVKLAVEEEPQFEVSDIEMNRADISYTVDTLKELKNIYPDTTMYLIIGADSLEFMNDWHQPGKIKKMARLVVAPRPGSSVPPVKDSEFDVVEMPEVPISSSEIRACLHQSKQLPSNQLPEKVEAYIRKNHLYQGSAQ